MKRCFKCGVEKPVDHFYRHSQMGDGRLGKCKECTKADVNANRQAKIDYFREYDRKRGACPKRRAQLMSLANREPRIQKASRILGNAVKRGEVVRAEACWHCGSTRNIEGHHAHYDYPLIVTWLCRSCHTKAHRETYLIERSATANRGEVSAA